MDVGLHCTAMKYTVLELMSPLLPSLLQIIKQFKVGVPTHINIYKISFTVHSDPTDCSHHVPAHAIQGFGAHLDSSAPSPATVCLILKATWTATVCLKFQATWTQTRSFSGQYFSKLSRASSNYFLVWLKFI